MHPSRREAVARLAHRAIAGVRSRAGGVVVEDAGSEEAIAESLDGMPRNNRTRGRSQARELRALTPRRLAFRRASVGLTRKLAMTLAVTKPVVGRSTARETLVHPGKGAVIGSVYGDYRRFAAGP